jgi:hypothetical protein
MNKYIQFYKSFGVKSKSTKMWADFLDELKSLILNDNIENFKDWGPIRQTMNAGNPSFGFSKDHLNLLKNHEDWNNFEKILKTEYTTNAVNHLFYLTKLQQFKLIKDFDTIFEFGAGFGNMCRIINSLGFDGTYKIFDFPELLTIQKYYLEKNTVRFSQEIKFLSNLDKENFNENSLFISTHALEESPPEVIQQVLKKIENFSSYLFACSGGKDVFENFIKERCKKILFEDFPTLKGHYIIVGVK